MAFSHDGKRVATGSLDKTVKLWEFPSGQEKLHMRGHQDAVCSLSFFPDGQTLLSASLDKTLRVWDLAEGKSEIHDARAPGLYHLRRGDT